MEVQLKKKGGSFVPDNMLQDPAYERARDSLVKQLGFSNVFGDNYEDDPRFKDAVNAVMEGRSPWLVIADFTDTPSIPRVPKDDGRGWAW